MARASCPCRSWPGWPCLEFLHLRSAFQPARFFLLPPDRTRTARKPAGMNLCEAPWSASGLTPPLPCFSTNRDARLVACAACPDPPGSRPLGRCGKNGRKNLRASGVGTAEDDCSVRALLRSHSKAASSRTQSKVLRTFVFVRVAASAHLMCALRDRSASGTKM